MRVVFPEFLIIHQSIFKTCICLFITQNGGEGVYQEKKNLIPQAFNIHCGFDKVNRGSSAEELQDICRLDGKRYHMAAMIVSAWLQHCND